MSGPASSANVIAAVCSFIFPGLGQLVQARIFTALCHFLISGLLWVFGLGWIMHIWSTISAARYRPPHLQAQS